MPTIEKRITHIVNYVVKKKERRWTPPSPRLRLSPRAGATRSCGSRTKLYADRSDTLITVATEHIDLDEIANFDKAMKLIVKAFAATGWQKLNTLFVSLINSERAQDDEFLLVDLLGFHIIHTVWETLTPEQRKDLKTPAGDPHRDLSIPACSRERRQPRHRDRTRLIADT